ncbi:MAG: D-alanyl-lipoteichoic acid biosynthesis protein DltD [Anaerolineae bacterium]
MKISHLIAATVAVGICLFALLGAQAYAEQLENQYVPALAPWIFPQRNQGSALQRAAFRRPDLLPIYGSSELNNEDTYDANHIFNSYPTGFAPFPVGMADTEPLIMVQKLAALGPDVRGKKVVISLSPSFYHEGQYHVETYNGNFSPLHANALAFSTELSWGTRQGIAQRMLDYPELLEQDPLLKFALQRITGGSFLDQALYDAALPLGKLHLFVLGLQDHWETINLIWKTPNLQTEIAHTPATINWPALATRAENAYKPHTSNNPFGMENSQYTYYRQMIDKGHNSSSDEKFLNIVQNSKGWTDLALLLDGLNDLGAEPLVILLPLHGGWFDWQGISYSARAVLYNRVRAIANAHNVKVVVMDDHDSDKYFLIDPGAHMSSKGWVYYDQVLDAFYNGKLNQSGK